MSERTPDHPIDPSFLARWSPRAFDGSDMPQADIDSIFEAARWAPSAFNAQPWRLLYARRGDSNWDRFLSLLIPWNRSWAHAASLLVYVLSDSLMETKPGVWSPSHSHSYDAGAAWACMALQATRLGYHAHGMSGVEFARAREALEVPERFRIEAAAAIGRIGDASTLPEKMRAREGPSGRKPIGDFAFAGNFQR